MDNAFLTNIYGLEEELTDWWNGNIQTRRQWNLYDCQRSMKLTKI